MYFWVMRAEQFLDQNVEKVGGLLLAGVPVSTPAQNSSQSSSGEWRLGKHFFEAMTEIRFRPWLGGPSSVSKPF